MISTHTPAPARSWTWEDGDRALTALAGGPIRARALWHRIQRVGPGDVLTTGPSACPITIAALTRPGRWRVTRPGHPALLIEQVSIGIAAARVTRTAIITVDDGPVPE